MKQMQHKNTVTSKPIKMNIKLYEIINLFTWIKSNVRCANERNLKPFFFYFLLCESYTKTRWYTEWFDVFSVEIMPIPSAKFCCDHWKRLNNTDARFFEKNRIYTYTVSACLSFSPSHLYFAIFKLCTRYAAFRLSVFVV